MFLFVLDHKIHLVSYDVFLVHFLYTKFMGNVTYIIVNFV